MEHGWQVWYQIFLSDFAYSYKSHFIFLACFGKLNFHLPLFRFPSITLWRRITKQVFKKALFRTVTDSRRFESLQPSFSYFRHSWSTFMVYSVSLLFVWTNLAIYSFQPFEKGWFSESRIASRREILSYFLVKLWRLQFFILWNGVIYFIKK